MEQENVQLVVDVGGLGTMCQSFKALRYGGTATAAGYLAIERTTDTSSGPPVSVMNVLGRVLVTRSSRTGSREHYEQMTEKMLECQPHWAFGFGEVSRAYEYLCQQKHIGKLPLGCKL